MLFLYLADQKQERTPSAANCKLNDSSKETCNLPSMLSLKQTTKPLSNAKSAQPVGFINKGNTCYANSITLWNRVPSKSNTLLPML